MQSPTQAHRFVSRGTLSAAPVHSHDFRKAFDYLRSSDNNDQLERILKHHGASALRMVGKI